MALDRDDIVDRFRKAIKEHTPQLAVRDALDALIASGDLDGALGPVELGGITNLHNSAELTVLRVVWTPGMRLNPHNHNMWAVIGMYGGTEDNAFYRRSDRGLVESGGKEVHEGDVLVLGDDVIHAVANTRQNFAAAIHVYGGDFFSGDRSEWDFETFTERPRDVGGTMRLFDEANQRWLADQPR
jgi:predicted metal-dependent enzyme (double-stranded beta helix superfamily)